MSTQFYSLAEVAKIVNKRPHQVTYAIVSGLVPDVVNRIAGKRAFTKQEVAVIKKHFGLGPDKEFNK